MTDSDEKGVFLLTLSAITEDKIVEIFLKAEQKPEGKTKGMKILTTKKIVLKQHLINYEVLRAF